MKPTRKVDIVGSEPDELRPEYEFDYRNARPNRFVDSSDQSRLVITLDSDVSQVFTTQESVNTVLRALITTMPSGRK